MFNPEEDGQAGIPTPASGPTFEQVNRDYQELLGRPLSQEEYQKFWANRTDYNRTMVANSKEGIDYLNQTHPEYSGQQAAPPVVPPTPGPTGGPPPAPVVGPAPTPSPQPAGGAPTFTPPSYTKPPAFSYADFVAPDPSKLDQDPLYLDTLHREQDAIQRSATARGVLNTGGTIDSLLRSAKDIAATGYANLFNRDLSTYQTNRGNALDAYNTNYGTQYQDPYKYNYMGAQDVYNSSQHNYDLSTQYNWYKNLFDFQKDQDLWNRKYQLLQMA